jgi:exopolyphosphatase/guanosine-5'-triphosphate,3'-diphosphate pyrophosphatase
VILLDRATVTRLGKDVDRTRKLAPEAVERSLSCLQDYADEMRALGVTALDVVGTSALRDVGDATDFLNRAEALLGTRPRIIEGDEEARLTCQGALSGLAIHGPFVVFDIGGGSTEIIVGTAANNEVTIQHFISIDIGCVRLTERHIASDPPTAAELHAVTSTATEALRSLPFDVSQGTLVGVAGTVTTLCAIHLGLATYDPSRVHGTTLERDVLFQQRRWLAQLSSNERREIQGLGRGRSDVIVAGLIIATQLLEKCAHQSFLVSDRGVRYGVIANLFRRR